MKNELVNEKDVCVLLGVSRSTLYRLRREDGLPYCKIGSRLIRYSVEQLDQWLKSYEKNSEEKNANESEI